MNSVSTIAKIPFYGDTIEAVKTDDGKIMVSLKRVCESLGVDLETQRRKLARCQWAVTGIMTATGTDGKRYQMTMIDHESLPMWLVTIHPSKVKAAVREKMLRYQREAKAVLSAWFLGTSSAAPELAAEFADVKARLAKLEQSNRSAILSLAVERIRADDAVSEADEANVKLDCLLRPFGRGCGDFMTIRDYCDTYGVMNDMGRGLSATEIRLAGRAAAAMSSALGIAVFKQETHLSPVNLYRLDILQAWRSVHDLRGRISDESFGKIKRLMRITPNG